MSPSIEQQRLSKHKLIVQLVEFMLGGGIHFFTGLLIFTILYSAFHVDWLIAKIIGDIIGWSLGYLVQRYVAFEDKRLKGKDTRVIRRYVVVNSIDFALDYIIVATTIWAGGSPYLGFVISAGLTTIWDYYWYRFWVFKP
ncbi:MAG: GtrA family protein [Cumulibacter sp.]